MDNGDVKHVERLIVDLKESPEREMREGFQAMANRFDAQSARLERQGSRIQAGSRLEDRLDK
jgi:hypothetical protein